MIKILQDRHHNPPCNFFDFQPDRHPPFVKGSAATPQINHYQRGIRQTLSRLATMSNYLLITSTCPLSWPTIILLTMVLGNKPFSTTPGMALIES